MTRQKITENRRRPTKSSPGMSFSDIYESLTNRKRGSRGFQKIDTRESVDLESPNASNPTSKGFHIRLRSWRKLAAFVVGTTLLAVTLLGYGRNPSMGPRRRMPLAPTEVIRILQEKHAMEGSLLFDGLEDLQDELKIQQGKIKVAQKRVKKANGRVEIAARNVAKEKSGLNSDTILLNGEELKTAERLLRLSLTQLKQKEDRATTIRFKIQDMQKSPDYIRKLLLSGLLELATRYAPNDDENFPTWIDRILPGIGQDMELLKKMSPQLAEGYMKYVTSGSEKPKKLNAWLKASCDE